MTNLYVTIFCVCVTNLCVINLCDKVVGDKEDAEEAAEVVVYVGGCQSKNKSPTQFCGEKMLRLWLAD